MLTGFDLGQAVLSPEFDPAVTEYTAEVASAVDSVSVTVNGTGSLPAIAINGTLLAEGNGTTTVNLQTGENLITVEIGEGAEALTYTITVTRLAPPALVLRWGDPPAHADAGSSINLGSQAPGTTQTYGFSIHNSGGEPLELTGTAPDLVLITDPADSPDLTVFAQPGPGRAVAPPSPVFSVAAQPETDSIPAGQSADFTVAVTLPQQGELDYSAGLSIPSNDPTTPDYAVTLEVSLAPPQ